MIWPPTMLILEQRSSPLGRDKGGVDGVAGEAQQSGRREPERGRDRVFAPDRRPHSHRIVGIEGHRDIVGQELANREVFTTTAPRLRSRYS